MILSRGSISDSWYLYWLCSVCPPSMPHRVYVTVGCLSARPSVCLSHRSTAAATAGGFAAERRRLQQILIDSWYARSPRSTANAGSVMLWTEGRGSTHELLMLAVNYRRSCLSCCCQAMLHRPRRCRCSRTGRRHTLLRNCFTLNDISFS